MRGKVLDRQIFPIIRRITPAYAGKRPTPPTRKDFTRDHPRLCGEKLPTKLTLPSVSRITPAYAGKSDGGLMTYGNE